MGCLVAVIAFGLKMPTLDLVIIGWELVGMNGWIGEEIWDCKGNESLNWEEDDGTWWEDNCWDGAGDEDATKWDEDIGKDTGVCWKVGNGKVKFGDDADTVYCGSDEEGSWCASWKGKCTSLNIPCLEI